ncbi:RmlC-like jelly roll fold containing protein [Cryptosporidium felis]|nr:RmlC-like jelly roll fold containing protein [Cryptosporidium felis]
MISFPIQKPCNKRSNEGTIKDIVKLYEARKIDFNSTISTLTSEPYSFEKSPVETRRSSLKIKDKARISKELSDNIFSLDQTNYEIHANGPLLQNFYLFKPKSGNSDCRVTKPNQKQRIDTQRKPSCNEHVLQNYLEYIWQVGDEFSDLHSFPLF